MSNSTVDSGADPSWELVLRDRDGVPETVYLTTTSRTTDDGWLVSSLDVGSWRPLAVGDRVVALDRETPSEFVVQVVAVEDLTGEVYYSLRHEADLDPGVEPALDGTRSWLPPT